MTEVPEHLLKRAKEARERAKAAKGEGDDAAPAEAAPAQAAEPAADAPAAAAAAPAAPAASSGGVASKVPAHLLERSKSAREQAEGGGAVATQAPPAAAPPAGIAPAAPPPSSTGPGGHTQRLLTVVKSGSIQDVRATPSDKVHTWPHLLVVEFVAALAVTAFTLVFSIFVNAPLLELANPNETPNPSKAPWYFMGLQELLTMFHPMVAGVTIPGIGIFLLILAPYIDRNPATAPEKRKFAVSLWTIHLMFWAALVIIGSFFRGPGFNFVFPWNEGLFFDL